MANKSVKKQQDTQQRITVGFGYGLFLLAIISLTVGLAPWGSLVSQPHAIHFNVIATMIAFALAAILPPLAGYFVGDKATRGKSKLLHHYNGVLFGVLGFWLATIFMAALAFVNLSDISFQANFPSYILGSILPAIIAVIVLLFLGVFYARHSAHQTSLLVYKPYRLLFIIGVVSLFVLSGISIGVSSWYGASIEGSLAVMLLPVVMIGVVVLFGAWLTGPKNGTRTTRFIKSLIAFSYGIIAMNFSIQLLWFNPALASWSVVIGIVVWAAYIYLLRRYPSLEK